MQPGELSPVYIIVLRVRNNVHSSFDASSPFLLPSFFFLFYPGSFLVHVSVCSVSGAHGYRLSETDDGRARVPRERHIIPPVYFYQRKCVVVPARIPAQAAPGKATQNREKGAWNTRSAYIFSFPSLSSSTEDRAVSCLLEIFRFSLLRFYLPKLMDRSRGIGGERFRFVQRGVDRLGRVTNGAKFDRYPTAFAIRPIRGLKTCVSKTSTIQISR